MYSRLTTATMYGTLLDSLQSSMRNMQELQKQIATGNKYTSLSDNPAAISRSLSIQSSLTANAQYQENTSNAITLLKHSHSALYNVLNAAETIRSLVIEAGDGALDSSQLQDISDQIEANKKIMLDNLNTKVAGQYIFGGTDTSTRPFVELADGSIEYRGSDDRIKYALSDSLLGDVSFSGNDIVPTDEDTYFICSHYVPIDWQWTGREEKVQITVGTRTLSVFIPEDWSDYDSNKTNSGNVNYSDDNGYRDPNEVTGISLDDLATIINNSLEQQGADMLVHASIEKDYQNGVQQLILRSNTGEKIGITGWPDTDYMPMEATLTSNEIDSDTWDTVIEDSDNLGETSGVMGNINIVSWHGTTESGTLTISVNDNEYEFDLSDYNTSTALIDAINEKISASNDGTPFASMTSGNLSGRLIFQTQNSDSNNNGKIDDDEVNTITVTGTGNAMSELFGTSESSLTSTTSSLTIKIGDSSASSAKIFINDNDTLSELSEKINAIAGIYSRTNAEGTRLIVTAQRTGQLPDDRLAINEALEALNYPSLTITGAGGALNMFEFGTDNSTKAQYTTRIIDHSHIDIFDYLGMETAMKSREFNSSETLTVKEGEQLHWKVMSGGKSVEIKLNPGDYTLDYIADRLKNAGAGWLEVTVSEDKNDDWERHTGDSEEATQRLVIRGYNGEQVLFIDMNSYNYADKLGLSTALRTDGYTDDSAGTGTKCVNFPSAPCVDDNIGVQMRVQMNCGMTYDVNIKKAEVINPETGFVDRNKVMQAIVNDVNSQAGGQIMGYTAHVDATGSTLDDSSAIYFLSGESFTVVDLPFSDPEWNDYSGGIAAQMGIHGGVTSNMKQTLIPMKDNAAFENAYSDVGETFREGTIRFENLGHSVEIDISADDTVKDIMDRLRTQAGDWLYVNYYDDHMGQVDARNAGDYPLIAISSVDGSAVNIIDVKGHIAQDALGISTGIQGRLNPDGTDEGIMSDDLEWNIEEQSFPASSLTITVAGYSHTIDLTDLRDVTDDNVIKADDVAEFINARMQDYDVKAEINSDNELVLWSPRGYTIQIEFNNENGNDVTSDFLGDEELQRTYYRGGYNLDGAAYGTDSRGLDAHDIYDSGIHTQNATIRSGANTAKQNGFGVINDIVSAVNAGNREDIENKMLPRLDNFINNILTVMSSNGALQARYNYNNERLTSENAIMTENYDNLVKIDPADAISQLMVADYMYQANLAIISRLIQPSLLDFLG